jgi:putative hydrolase of the HAD superfamily
MLHICRLIHNALPKVQFKNIIFDLGGVLLDLEVQKTYEAFSKLTGIPVAEVKSILGESHLFLEYEKGNVTDDLFRAQAKDILGLACSDFIFDNAWNQMLGDLPMKRLELLSLLKGTHRTFLLSNTNQIHKTHFSSVVKQNSGGTELDNFFTKAYYSHLIKMRKPDSEIFEFVLSENKLVADETIFLDDNISNLGGAEKLGIKTHLITHPEMTFTLF